MSPYLKPAFRTSTTWSLAAFINALLCGSYVSIREHYPKELVSNTLLSFFASLLFFAPGFFVFWIVLILKLSNGVFAKTLFRAALSTGFFLAAATAILFGGVFRGEFSAGYMLILFIISPIVTSIDAFQLF
ncbi:MAG: hypothetical protein ABI416_17810 [Ginsengibacter sp.]